MARLESQSSMPLIGVIDCIYLIITIFYPNIHIASSPAPRHFPIHMKSISPPSSPESRPYSHIHNKDRLDKGGNVTGNRREAVSIWLGDPYKFWSSKVGGEDRGAYLLPRQNL